MVPWNNSCAFQYAYRPGNVVISHLQKKAPRPPHLFDSPLSFNFAVIINVKNSNAPNRKTYKFKKKINSLLLLTLIELVGFARSSSINRLAQDFCRDQ